MDIRDFQLIHSFLAVLFLLSLQLSLNYQDLQPFPAFRPFRESQHHQYYQVALCVLQDRVFQFSLTNLDHQLLHLFLGALVVLSFLYFPVIKVVSCPVNMKLFSFSKYCNPNNKKTQLVTKHL